MSRVIFLDFDGVLTLELERPGVGGATTYKFSPIDPLRIVHLNEIVARTGADVVVTSSWRHRRTPTRLQEILQGAGFTGRVRDKTPNLGIGRPPGSTRGIEIFAWLSGHQDVDAFVMLDDGRHTSGLFGIEERLVQTTSAGGLEPSHVEKAVKILTSGRCWTIQDFAPIAVAKWNGVVLEVHDDVEDYLAAKFVDPDRHVPDFEAEIPLDRFPSDVVPHLHPGMIFSWHIEWAGNRPRTRFEFPPARSSTPDVLREIQKQAERLKQEIRWTVDDD